MFNKVLLISASAGAGHVRAAQALERAFEITGLARDVRHVDALEYTTKVFRDLYSKTYLDMARRAPDLLGWLYDQYDRPWKDDRLRVALEKLNTQPLVRLLNEYAPDFVVCTHFLPSELISHLCMRDRLSCRQAIVVTDFDVHAMWLCRHYEHYFVALEETRVHLEKLGIAPSKLTATGVPIDPVFMEPKDKREMRRRHGLDPEPTTILVSAGGFGVGPIDHLMTSLLELRHPAQVVVACGRNTELRERIESIDAGGAAGRVRLHPIGFTDQMDELMAASDMVLGKPGGLTTSEALSKGLVFVIVNPIPGQEERNADHLLEQGAAIRCNNLPVLAWKIDRLLDDTARFATMQKSVLKMARPRAAIDIVEKLAGLRGESTGETSPSS